VALSVGRFDLAAVPGPEADGASRRVTETEEHWRARAGDRSDHASSTCATFDVVTTVGLRELRQQASELVRRVEAGEEVTITVAGRPSARLVAVSPRSWRSWNDVADLFTGPADPTWEQDRELIAQEIQDPWIAS
jgi:prevent-host-death family protein